MKPSMTHKDTDRYDMVVLGGGTGGYSAAFRARELGMTAAIVEREKLGGICLHRGCIPTKSLLQAANLLETVRRAPAFGLKLSGDFDWKQVMLKKRETVTAIYEGLKSLAQAKGVDIIAGDGRLEADDFVTVDGGPERRRLGFETAVLATGSRPRTLAGLDPGSVVLTSNEALELEELPSSVIVIGGGYIGVEFASMWRSFGVEVTIVENAPRLMIQEEEEISELLAGFFRERGIRLILDAEIVSTEIDDGVAVRVRAGGTTETIRAEKLLTAVGRSPITEAFADAGVEVTPGAVQTDSRQRTSRPGVYAVGDLLPSPQLAHAAFAEGIFVAEEVAGLSPAEIDYDALPHCAYTHPEIGAVGLTEARARERGHEVEVVRESFRSNARARIAGEPEGQVKIVAVKGGPILGVHMIGPGVSELTAEAMLMIGWEADAADVSRLIHPHPTLSEAIGEAALKLAGKPLHSR